MIIKLALICCFISFQRVGSNFFPWPSIFLILRFPNDPCPTTNGLTGTCYTYKECLHHGGEPKGSCARGYGACCLFETTCGSVSRENNTYFSNPDYPNLSNLTSDCDVIINPIARNSGICQYLVTVEMMELSQPTNGRCEGYSDSWTFTVGNRTQDNYGLPVNGLCGKLTNQHFYLDINNEESLSMKITPAFDTEMTGKKWRIRVSQFTCDSEFKAPMGCLQYYTTKTAQISSLNYDASYFDQLLYSACVNSGSNDCKIQWESDAEQFQFGATSQTGSGVGDVDCTDDYVTIPSGSINTKDRYCGSSFNSVSGQITNEPITSNHKPFMIRVKTDDTGVRKGFKLRYTLIPCN